MGATAYNVTETGFALQITSSEGAPLASAGVAWAAWPELIGWGQPNVKIGSFSTVKPRGPKVSNLQAEGTMMKHTIGGSNIFLAVSTVHMVLEGSVWMDLSIKEEEQYGESEFGWNMKAGPAAARLYSAIVVYVSQ